MPHDNSPTCHPIIDTLRRQLQTDLFLGGRWLPMGHIDLHALVRSASRTNSRANTTRPAKTPKAPTSPRTSRQTTTAPAPKTPSPAPTPPKTPPPPANPKQLAQKQRRLDDIAQKVRDCNACPLHQTRTNAVPGEVNPDARIVFVGEAPGADEDAQGRPFVGRAGKLLTNIIEAMGLQRADVFICNILKCRPPENRNPQTTEIAACIDYLHQQLAVIEPDIIIALGAYAARTLLDTTEAIGRLRGRVHQYYPNPTAAPTRLVATYHPAYLLRNYAPDTRRRVWEDMKLVLRELNMPIPRKKPS